MAVVALKPLPMAPSPDGYVYFDQITFSVGSPPDRPDQQPPLGIWGPTDPRPTHPIAGWNPGTGTWPQPPLGIWGPTDPRPTHPIAGWNPATGTWPDPKPPEGGGGAKGVAIPYPPNLPVPPKPEGMPEGSVPVIVLYPGEKYPAVGWLNPYPSSGPVPVPPPVPAPA